VSTWSVVLALGTLVVMVVGEKINAKLPWALAAVLAATILSAVGSLANHGVQQLGTVSAGLPIWRLHWLSGPSGDGLHDRAHPGDRDLSQSAATSRTTADELGIADNISRDFVGVGWRTSRADSSVLPGHASRREPR